jgi:UDP-glucose 4-epimerase
MKILITGGAGYIGSHVALVALLAGHTVTVVDTLERGYKQALEKLRQIAGKDVKFYQGNVGDEAFIDEVLKTEKFDVVIHCAGYKSVGEGELEKEKYTKNNVENSRLLMQKCIDHGVKKFIFSSSAATYGIPQYLPIDENHPQAPINHYGLTKLQTEHDMQKLADTANMKMIALRYFNAVGNHESGEIGEDYRAATNLLPIVFATLAGLRDKMFLFGDKFSTADGTQERDYVHVMDLAHAHLAATEKDDYENNFTAYNLSTGTPTSCKKIVDLAEEISRKKLNYEVVAPRPGDPEKVFATNTKAKQELAWSPTRDIATSISNQWTWYQKSGGSYIN